MKHLKYIITGAYCFIVIGFVLWLFNASFLPKDDFNLLCRLIIVVAWVYTIDFRVKKEKKVKEDGITISDQDAHVTGAIKSNNPFYRKHDNKGGTPV